MTLPDSSLHPSPRGEKAPVNDALTVPSFLLLFLLGTMLRLYHLGCHSLWADEGFSLFAAKMSLPALVEFITRFDAHPPLFYVVLHFFTTLGTSEALMRVPSFLAGTGALLAAAYLARALYNRHVSLMTTFFVAISASLVYTVQEARMYPMLSLLSLLAAIFFIRLTKRFSYRDTLIYGFLLILCLYTHYLGFCVIASHGLSLMLLYRDSPSAKAAGAAMAAAALSFTPWLPHLVVQLSSHQGPTALVFHPVQIIQFFTAAFAGFTFLAPPWTAPFLLVIFLALIVPLTGIIACRSRDTSLLFLFIMTALPLVLLVIVSFTGLRQLFSVKYLSYTVPFYFMILAAVLDRLRARGLRHYALLFLAAYMLVNAGALYNWYFIPGFQKQRWKEAITYVNAQAGRHDAMLIQDFFQIYCLRYYLAQDASIYMVRPGEMPGPLEEIARSHERIWYIASCGWRIRDPELVIPKWLDTHMENVSAVSFESMEGSYSDVLVLLFRKPQGGSGKPPSP
ncbi:MAG: glycosyltransferase family 39 protein [Candidatus Eremiobacteraeota bacterium]|nr:glycosyltransferase family 39 protein [Candidatus Eremiobacteraeota bacterium]